MKQKHLWKMSIEKEMFSEFPEETGCGLYGFEWEKIIVGKTIAQRFLKEHDVPAKFRK